MPAPRWYPRRVAFEPWAVSIGLSAAGVPQRGDDDGKPSGTGACDVASIDGDLAGQRRAQRLGAGELTKTALAGTPNGGRVDQHPALAEPHHAFRGGDRLSLRL